MKEHFGFGFGFGSWPLLIVWPLKGCNLPRGGGGGGGEKLKFKIYI